MPVRLLQRFSIRAQLLALTLAVSIPLLGLVAYVTHQGVRAAEEDAQDAMLRLAQLTAAHLQWLVTDSQRVLELTGSRPALRSLQTTDCRSRLSDLASAYPHINEVLLFDTSGRITCSATGRPPAIPQGSASALWLQRLIAGWKPVPSDPLIDPATGEWIVLLGRRTDGTARPAGALVIQIGLARFDPSAGMDLPSGAVVTVLDRSATVVFRSPDAKSWVGQSVSESEIATVALKRGTGHVRARGFDGIERVFGFAPVPGTNWSVHAGIPAALLLENTHAMVERSLVTGGLLVLALAAGAAALWRRIQRPIRNLERLAHSVAGGDLTARAPLEGSPEIAAVAAQFNRMLEIRASSEAMFRQLLEVAPDGIVIVDGQGTIRLVNAQTEALFGYRREELVGQPVELLVPDRFRRGHVRHRESYSGAAMIRPMGQLSGKRKDGTEIPIEITLSRLETDEGPLISSAIRDVSERKAAEQALRQAEARFRRLIESRIIGVIITDTSGAITEANDLFLSMLGYTHDDLPIRWDELTPIEWQHLDAIAIERLRSRGEALPWEKEYFRKDKTRLPVLVGVTMLDPVTEQCLAFVLDLTERKRVEREVGASEWRYRSFIEQAPVAIITFAPNGSVQQMNRAWEELWETSHDEMSRYNVFRDRRLERKGVMEHVRRAFHGASVYLPPLLYGPADNPRWVDERWVEISLYPIRDQDGAVREVVMMMENVSARKTAEEAVRSSEERYRSLVLATAQIVWTSGPHGEVTDPLVQWRDFTGQSGDELKVEGGWARAIHPEDLSRAVEGWRAAIASQAMYETEYRLRRKDGEYRYMAVRGVPVRGPDGRVREWVGTSTDITERKVAEQALLRLNEELERRVNERTAQLQAANRELEAFSYSVSHDLRAPLRHLTGFANLLIKREAGRLDETSTRYVRALSGSAARMGELIDDLLSFARTNRAELRKQRVDVSRMIGEVRQELMSAAENRQIDWEIAPLPVVEADPTLLRIVWSNLLSNAIKFTARREPARIEVGVVRELPSALRAPTGAAARDAIGMNRPRSNGNAAGDPEVPTSPIFFVRDNGVGFDPSYAEKMFGVFQRLHSNDEFPGNGIGLATVSRIIHRHGGEVWAEGSIDGGATFYFQLQS